MDIRGGVKELMSVCDWGRWGRLHKVGHVGWNRKRRHRGKR